ncbi:MAG: hypothetical protein AAGA30_19350 [Planctomycetota bacterium]
MISILISAIVLGVLIATTNDGDFPDWTILIICLAAAIVPCAILNFALPANLFFVGPIVGAICCAATISATLGMPVVRASFSAGMFFFIQIGMAMFLGG